MAELHCSDRFHVVQRTPDHPFFDQAFRDLVTLHKAGLIEGAFCVRLNEKGLDVDLEVSVWRDRRSVPDEAWVYAVDPEGPDGLSHQYTKTFDRWMVVPSDVVYHVQQLLFCPFDGSACALCEAPVGPDGAFKMFEGAQGDLQLLPLCRIHLADFEK